MATMFSQMRGGDKAPVLRKAEAKAGRYAPFFKNVDDFVGRVAQCLTRFDQNLAAAGRRRDKMLRKISKLT
jgi:hypothetical protein